MELTPTPTQEAFITQELRRFEITEADLLELVKQHEYLTLTHLTLEDKDGLKRVHDARIQLKNRRVDIQKKGKAIRDSAVAFQKAVIARENSLVEILAPMEKSLQAQEDAVEQAKEALRVEAERQESARIQDRLDALARVGTSADFHTVRGMTDDQFVAFLNEATTEHKMAEENKERERLKKEDEAKAEKERMEQLAKEQAAERLRLQKIADEQEKVRAEQEAAQRKLDDERRSFEETKAKEAAEKKRLEDQAKAEEEARKEGIREGERLKQQEVQEAEQKRLAAEEEKKRLEAEAPDKEKVYLFATRINLLIAQAPIMTTSKFKKRLDHVLGQLDDIYNFLKSK